MVKTVNILGTEYRIEVHKRSEDEFMRKNGADGYCSADGKLIVIADTSEKESFPDMTDIEQSTYRKRLLRHEITHAFLDESGLQHCSSVPMGAWARHEEMVDWIAIQFPKIMKAFQEVGAL